LDQAVGHALIALGNGNEVRAHRRILFLSREAAHLIRAFAIIRRAL
jgi:hypothetical protein